VCNNCDLRAQTVAAMTQTTWKQGDTDYTRNDGVAVRQTGPPTVCALPFHILTCTEFTVTSELVPPRPLMVLVQAVLLTLQIYRRIRVGVSMHLELGNSSHVRLPLHTAIDSSHVRLLLHTAIDRRHVRLLLHTVIDISHVRLLLHTAIDRLWLATVQ